MALNPIQSLYEPVYVQDSLGKGIGGYGLESRADRIFAFDYNCSGKTDHLVLTRDIRSIMWILKMKSYGKFATVYANGEPGHEIGRYRSREPRGGGFAFDYDHSGKLDHIALYGPGSGFFAIFKFKRGKPSVACKQVNGIGGYDLKHANDLAFAFDYDHSGRQDHLVFYRPGTGTLWILKNEKGTFRPVFAQGNPGRGKPGQGIGGYDLQSHTDRAFAFDYDRSGNLDHIVLYRPGAGIISILRNRQGIFDAVYRQGDPGAGIGGYDLISMSDRVFAFDNDGSGRADHLVLYRPGRGAISILKNFSGEFLPVYAQGNLGKGIGGYDLMADQDLVFGFDYSSSGRSNFLTLYRPGEGLIWILHRFGTRVLQAISSTDESEVKKEITEEA